MISSRKYLAIMIAAALVSAALASAALASPKPAADKTKHHKHQKCSTSKRRYGSYLVPPPPAYMPSILPELQTAENKEPEKPRNPYKKYVYSREGHEDPPPIQPNKYVTYWNSKS